jgi:hypothetical protein
MEKLDSNVTGVTGVTGFWLVSHTCTHVPAVTGTRAQSVLDASDGFNPSPRHVLEGL